ncbi:MAG: hypothetical protein M9927_21410 [Anaerolineae bacterium]|nr:hypothetical protein [Anaerolineae bacterium]
MPVWCGGMLETNVGRAGQPGAGCAAQLHPAGDISASERYYARDVAEPNFTLNTDSTITVPDQPGIGVEVDMEALASARLRELTLRAE